MIPVDSQIGTLRVVIHPMTNGRLRALENLIALANLEKVRSLRGMIEDKLFDAMLEEAEYDLSRHRFTVFSKDGLEHLNSMEGSRWFAAVACAEVADAGDMQAIVKAAKAIHQRLSELPPTSETWFDQMSAGWKSFELARLKKDASPDKTTSPTPAPGTETSGPAGSSGPQSSSSTPTSSV